MTKQPFTVKTSIKPKKTPPIYIVRAVNAEWEVNNGSYKVKAGSINEAFKAMFEWETKTAAELRAGKRNKPPVKMPKKKKS